MLPGNSWRPDGWEDPYGETAVIMMNWRNADGTTKLIDASIPYSVFEEGASAMLSALRQLGKDSFTNQTWKKGQTGICVFIPDEEKCP